MNNNGTKRGKKLFKSKLNYRQYYLLVTMSIFILTLISIPPPIIPAYIENYRGCAYDKTIENLIKIMNEFPEQDTMIYLSEWELFKFKLINVQRPNLSKAYHSDLIQVHPLIFKTKYKHVFIIVEKPTYKTPYCKRPEDNRSMPLNLIETEKKTLDWCKRYDEIHDGVSIYFENENIIIYHIKNLNT